MTRVISVRLPAAWEGHVNAATARESVLAWIRQPQSIAHVPPPGSYKLNLRLSRVELGALKRISNRSTSLAIRGVLGLRFSVQSVQPKRGLEGMLGLLTTGIVLALFIAGVGQHGGQNR
jgi:hypothetical protein